jgi:hypothetical protein
LVPVLRPNGETFTEASVAAEQQSGIDTVVNGELYDVDTWGKGMLAVGATVNPSDISPQGEIIQNGQQIAGGKPSSQTFYVSETIDKNGNTNFVFGQGNPPANSTVAFGGGIPVIVNDLPYGPQDLYAPGVPAGAPTTGDPGAQYSGYLQQRSNAGFASFSQLDQATNNGVGKVLIAYNSNQDALAIIVQPNGVQDGMSLSSLRDQLVTAGFDDALEFDGSSSATLVRNGQVQIAPTASYKNNSIEVGIGIKRGGP